MNIDNIDAVLATLSNKIQFLVKKGQWHSPDHASPAHAAAALLSPPPPPSPHMGSSGGLVRLVAGGRSGGGGLAGGRRKQRHLHMLLYITLDVKEDDPPEKVPRWGLVPVFCKGTMFWGWGVRELKAPLVPPSL